MTPRTGILAVLLALLLAAPASAVVGGEPAESSAYPSSADVGNCGGTLIAPDRVMTAEHCVRDRALDQLAIGVAGQTRLARGIAMAPGWQHRNGSSNVYDDIALVLLDRPVEGVTPVTLGGAPTELATILGKGKHYAPGTGHDESESYGTRGLRQAQLRTLRAPTACPPCSPRWTATAASSSTARPWRRRWPASKITGKARVGRKLRCSAPRFNGGATKVATRWTYLDSQGAPKTLGSKRTYRVQRRARGKRISCLVEGSNAGGPALAPPASVAVPR